jgi:amidase
MTVASASEALRASAARQAALVRSGELSARELVEASFLAIERLDPAVNAFAIVCPERALAEADSVRPGDERPLCGVPLAVKDLLGATEGLPTTHGSAAFGDWVADHDTAHVRRLREAGAIVVGKTTTPELGLRPVTESARFGVTRNPWNLDLSAGGSSGGSAAAVVAGMVGLAEGSDLGGSIRIPAACCGVVGLKPSRGRVSIGPDFGAVGGGTPADGPIARTTLDVAIALDAMAQYEPGDYHWIGQPARTFVEATRQSPARVRICFALSAPLGVPVDEEPRAAAERAATLLSELGHDVREEAPEWDDDAFPWAWSTFVTGTMQHIVRVLERLHGRPVEPARAEPATRSWLLDTPPVSLLDYLEAQERLVAFSRRILRSWPADAVLVTPTLTRLPARADALRAEAGVTDDAVRFSALVRVWNVTGQPAISLPLAETGDGVPVGVQLVGPPGREDLLLGLAAQLEATAGWAPHVPLPVKRLEHGGSAQHPASG